MSRDSNRLFVLLFSMIIMLVIALVAITLVADSKLQDLQRRVGQLEQNEKKMVDILDKLARHAASEPEQVRR